MAFFVSMKHFNIRIAGKVQGVFFRANTKTQADQLGVVGFVRNEPDGSVYVEVEGNDESLQRFIKWCYHGPKFAEVVQCDISEADVKHFTEFVIHR